MQSFKLSIPENNDQAKALILYLKSLDFIQLVQEKDWMDELDSQSLLSIQKGLDDLNSGKTHTDDFVRNAIHTRINTNVK